ncbi:spore coat protein [Paenibacillus chitinolyticus]|uniref:spore coat protein n=1 Tax=Paenibacillus chitinolyticus TaxID=79263 RepID=UPI001C47E382|nr:spore coat protein [Paenibacillus chitinolyticus]MBV6713242.1 spore coat protein [Paenibacillus chitinolyticus]
MSLPKVPKHLAWHETLELHELVSLQTGQLIAFKQKLPTLTDEGLQTLFREAIQTLEQNLNELLAYYPKAPASSRNKNPEPPVLEAGQLLGFAKTAVRGYACALTETATPRLRATFVKHLLRAVEFHAKVFNRMYADGAYPAYDLKELLENDAANARAALSLE